MTRNGTALATAPPGAPQRLVRARLRRDELEQAESLVAEHRIGRWNALLNRLLASVDLITLASGSYVTAAVETAFMEVQRTRAPRMPEAERKALALYKRFVERFPDDPRSAEVAEKVAALEADRKGIWKHEHLTRAGKALEEDRIEDAEFHAQLAAVVDPEAREVDERLREIDAAPPPPPAHGARGRPAPAAFGGGRRQPVRHRSARSPGTSGRCSTRWSRATPRVSRSRRATWSAATAASPWAPWPRTHGPWPRS